MEKLKLLGIEKSNGRLRYSFGKRKSFIPLFSNFLLHCGFTDIEILEHIDIFEERLYMKSFDNSKHNIDLFILEDKIILLIRTSEKDFVQKEIENMVSE